MNLNSESAFYDKLWLVGVIKMHFPYEIDRLWVVKSVVANRTTLDKS